ncbi:MAG: glucose 1-dehydrogenase [Acetobacteraceae bacterium]|nr:glucose 1-dehydrogenase [Acetobacteraceae bacterium]
MTRMLDGKVAMITGGGGGIGRATCLTMAREGATIAVADTDLALAEETAAAVRATGAKAIVVTGDVTNEAQVKAMVDSVAAQLGRIDIAYNNAGISHAYAGASGLKTHELPLEVAEKVLDINIIGVWLCMKYEIIQMLTQGGGAIVNTASIAGLIGLPTSSLYVASKHGVIGLTKTAALEYAEQNIRVNAVCPGFIETRMTKDAMARRGNEIMQQVPFHRMGQPQEIAECVTWLASDRASFVSGVAYAVDGGFTAA